MSMTNQCRAMIAFCFAGVLLGVVRNQGTVQVISLTVLLWIALTAMWFQLRVWWYLRSLKVTRSVNSREDAGSVLWVGRPVPVKVILRSKAKAPRNTRVEEIRSEKLRLTAGSDRQCLTQSMEEVTLDYVATPLVAGWASWFGVAFEFRDPAGLFWYNRSVRLMRKQRVLPGHATVIDPKPIVKRINAMPRHGIHQLQRAGLGSELLDLREYQVGDPPKSIAWKISARRDVLMTRQYEAEVPVRVNLILEGGEEIGSGHYGQRIVDRMVHLAACAARGVVSAGDPIGLVALRPGLREREMDLVGEKGFYRLLESLAGFADHRPVTGRMPTEREAELLYQVLRNWAPEWFDHRVNPRRVLGFAIRPWRRRQQVRRLQLSLVMAEYYRLPLAIANRLPYDDGLFQQWFWKCFAEFQLLIPRDVAAVNQQSRKQVAERCEALAAELNRRVAIARDNEVFVLCTTLLDPSSEHFQFASDQLSPVVRVIVGRHHRMCIIVPVPGWQASEGWNSLGPDADYDQIVRLAMELGRIEQARGTRKTIRRMGATFALADPRDVVSRVLAEVELAGRGRTTKVS